MFENQVAVVSGAAHGIGAAIARRLGAQGADVALLDVADCSEATAAVDIAEARTLGLSCDVSSPADLEQAFTQIEQTLGTPTLAVASAGVIQTVPFLELRDADWDLTLDVNFKGTAFLFQEAARRMVNAGLGGRMVALSSVAAKGARPTSADYAASNARGVTCTDRRKHSARTNRHCR